MDDLRGQFGGGPVWPVQEQPPSMPPSLLQMAQGIPPQMAGESGRGFGGVSDNIASGFAGGGGAPSGPAFGLWSSLFRNNTPEGDRYARRYADHLQWVADNPHMQHDDNTVNTIAGFGADYARANNITYDPPATTPETGWGAEAPGFRMPGEARPERVDHGSGFRMDGKLIAVPGVEGDAGRQLNRLPPALRNALGPAVVQHIISSGSPGFAYPGSLAYMGTVPAFEPGESYRLNRDAWGRGFAVGSSDMPHPGRPRP